MYCLCSSNGLCPSVGVNVLWEVVIVVAGKSVGVEIAPVIINRLSPVVNWT